MSNNIQNTNKQYLIRISEFFFLVLFIYMAWFQQIYFQISNFLLICGFAMVLPLVIYMIINNTMLKELFNAEINLLLVFCAFSIISGLFVVRSGNIPQFLSSLFSFSESVILIIAVCFAIKITGDLKFFLFVVIIAGLLQSATLIFSPSEIIETRFTLGTMNPNGLSVMLTFATFSVLYLLDFNKFLLTLLQLLIVMILIYATILTGSRKGFISQLILVVFWVAFVLFWKLKYAKLSYRILTGVLCVLFLAYITSWMINVFPTTDIYGRLMDLETELTNQTASGGTRLAMFNEAIDLFLNNPLIGIGYDQFRNCSSFNTYSHSMYAELLSCSGLMGTIIMVLLIFSLLLKLLKSFFSDQNKSLSTMWIVLISVMLFMGTGTVTYYFMDFMLFVGIIIAYVNSNKNQNNMEVE